MQCRPGLVPEDECRHGVGERPPTCYLDCAEFSAAYGCLLMAISQPKSPDVAVLVECLIIITHSMWQY